MLMIEKWDKKLQKGLYGIADPFYKDHILEKIRAYADEPAGPEETVLQLQTVEKYLLNPVAAWIARQKKDNVAVQAAILFENAIQDIILGLETYGITDFDIKKLGDTWGSFLIHADGGGIDHSENQREKAKKPREKKVNDIISRAYQLLPEGTAKEIWPELFHILEDEFADNIVQEIGNKKQPLTWKYKYSGGTLSFKTFQNKLTKIKTDKKI